MGGPIKWLWRLRGTQAARNQTIRKNAGMREGNTLPDAQYDVILTYDAERPRPAITWPVFCALLAAFLLFKSGAIAWYGPDVYGASIQQLQNGSLVERFGAFVMRPDVVSQALADQIRVPVF